MSSTENPSTTLQPLPLLSTKREDPTLTISSTPQTPTGATTTKSPHVSWAPTLALLRQVSGRGGSELTALNPTPTQPKPPSLISRTCSNFASLFRKVYSMGDPRYKFGSLDTLTLQDLGSGPNSERPDNKVVTAKYTWYSYLPRSFLEQFRIGVNVYFVIIFIIAEIGNSSLGWFDSPLVATGFLEALLVVIIVTMVFEGFYDFFRWREDRKVNYRTTRRISPTSNKIELVKWSELRAGDVVFVQREEMFPADLVMLSSRYLSSSELASAVHSPNPSSPLSQTQSDPDFDATRCYVETSNIDGETNLKIRSTPLLIGGEPFVLPPHLPEEWFSTLHGWRADYAGPSAQLDFSGSLSQPTLSSRKVPLDFTHLLLRGSVLKNTPEIAGVVVYAGYETKAVMSTKATRTKTSNVIILVNQIILLILFVGLVMVLVSAGVAYSLNSTTSSVWYLRGGGDFVFGPFFAPFFNFVILYAAILPIALILAITLTNFAQAVFVNWDIEMYDPEKDRGANCATLELAQEIGQVSFLFSDKTGTLTRNEMKLVGLSVVNSPMTYGVGGFKHTNVTAADSTERIFADLSSVASGGSHASAQESERARELILALAVCHTVIVDGHGADLRYNAEGPDEEALVLAAAKLGFRLISTSGAALLLETKFPAPLRYSLGSPPLSLATAPPTITTTTTSTNSTSPKNSDLPLLRFEVLGVNRFDSVRKRMSAVVRLPNGQIELFCKGADSIMFKLLGELASDSELESRSMLGRHLDEFARNGFRTLVVASRHVPADEYRIWSQAYADAYAAVGEERQRLTSAAADMIEHGLELRGATAIEDRLQEGVPDTLRVFREAGIKTWVLTGDKVETAVNIGFSAGLLTQDMDIVEVVSSDLERNLESLKVLRQAVNPGYLASRHSSTSHAGGGGGIVVSPGRASIGGGTPSRHNSETSFTSRISGIVTNRSSNRVVMHNEASGEDPYGIGVVVENGFHRFANAIVLGRKHSKDHGSRSSNTPRVSGLSARNSGLGTSQVTWSDAPQHVGDSSLNSARKVASFTLGSFTGKKRSQSEAREPIIETDLEIGFTPDRAQSASPASVLKSGKQIRHGKGSLTPNVGVKLPIVGRELSRSPLPDNNDGGDRHSEEEDLVDVRLTTPAARDLVRGVPGSELHLSGLGLSTPINAFGGANGNGASTLTSSGSTKVSSSERIGGDGGGGASGGSGDHAERVAEAFRAQVAREGGAVVMEPVPETQSSASVGPATTTATGPEAGSKEMTHVAQNLALVISGNALEGLLSDASSGSTVITELEHLFLSVAKVCSVVLACRVSPKQKAMLVRLVRHGVTISGVEPITMAVGDGANDVAMIQEARVGVGIAGREGSQAVNAADFSIAQFRFLQRLLLVHGRTNYRRMAMVVLYVLYSNLILIVNAFFYNTQNLWSGTSPYVYQWITAYSYIIVVPCIIAAAFNKDVRFETALKFPSLYVSGRANLHLGTFKMLEYILKAIVHTAVISFLLMYVLTPPNASYLDMGTVMYFSVLAVSQSRLVVEIYSWVVPTVIFCFLAFTTFFWLEPLIYSGDPLIYTLYGNTVLYSSYFEAWAWAATGMVLGAVIVLDLVFSAFRRQFFPNMIDIVLEIDRGYGGGTNERAGGLADADLFFSTLAVPLKLPRDALRGALRTARRIALVPRFRSAYAHDVADRPATLNERPPPGASHSFVRRSWSALRSFGSLGVLTKTPKNANANGGNGSSGGGKQKGQRSASVPLTPVVGAPPPPTDPDVLQDVNVALQQGQTS